MTYVIKRCMQQRVEIQSIFGGERESATSLNCWRLFSLLPLGLIPRSLLRMRNKVRVNTPSACCGVVYCGDAAAWVVSALGEVNPKHC